MKEPKLIKVILEYEDRIMTLKGKLAQDWIDEINSQIIFGFAHGQIFPEFKWKVKKK